MTLFQTVKPAALTIFTAVALSICGSASAESGESLAPAALTKLSVAKTITEHARKSRFPTKLQFEDVNGETQTGFVKYTFDESVHAEMADVYLRYQPDYACFVAIDVETGAILNLTSFIKSDEKWDNLVMRADYPAASVFKMVTAAAGIDLGKVSPESVIPFNGKGTTLYKNQVLRHKTTKWTRTPTFEESFAKSVNPVFARLGIDKIGADNLRDYAKRFGFGTPLNSDFMLPVSQLGLSMEDKWEVAEAASGFTRDITLSPIHAAQMAATIANNGKLVTPYMVDSVVNADGIVLYQAHAVEPQSSQVVKSSTATALRTLMNATTRIGSARKSFQGLDRYKVYHDMQIGGKTGSLTGESPRGRHDWFVGYAEKDGRQVAYASLIINKEKWYVRSAYVARQFIYHYFTEQMQAKAKAESMQTAVAE